MPWLILLLFCYQSMAQTLWNAQNFPNPTAGQFKQCGMRTHAKICDPDGVLDEGSRNRLDYELQQLETRTRQINGRDFCEKKGVTPAMAIAKRIQGGSTEDIRAMANQMLRTWTLDGQCKKSVVIVVSTEDAKFWVARDDMVPVYAAEFDDLFMKQKDLFKRKQYVEALKNLLQGTWEKAVDKQGPGTPRQPPKGTGGAASGGFNGGNKPGFGGSSGGPTLPSIPKWLWLALIFIIIPLLFCCCLYCCCCRGRGSGSGGGGRQPVPQDIPQGGGGRGGGRGPFGNFMSTLGGAGVGSMLGNFLSNRNRGGGGGMGMGGMGPGYGGGEYQGGGAYPAEPQPRSYDDSNEQGRGLYPSIAVKDEGGGGSWA